MQVVVLGGGAAGFFAAIACAEANASCRVTLLERTSDVLAKVKISGGGRCNVTHACFDPAQLVTFYPRGGQALRGPFSRFQPRDTVKWFEDRGVALKTEEDGRIFPVTNLSQTIFDCLTESAERAHVTVRCQALIASLKWDGPAGGFTLRMDTGESLAADRLIFATGSSPQGWEWARGLGHTIEPPVPSLFTFTVPVTRLAGLAGVSVPAARVRLEGSVLEQSGALLVTHWGLSGPAVLKLSAWAARDLHERGYQAELRVNWLAEVRPESILAELRRARQVFPRKAAAGNALFKLPKRLWASLAAASGIPTGRPWSGVSNAQLLSLSREIQDGRYAMTGKSVFKEEFVTCGGVRLDEVDFRTLESKRCPHLYFAGEVLDIDGLTGGFNFQSAWTTGWLAGRNAALSGS